MAPGAKKESKSPRGGLSIARIVGISMAFCALLIASLYLFHRLEQFLIRDPRFALNGVEGDTEDIEIAGAVHASRAQIERVFAIDVGRSVYLLPMADRREALLGVDWIKDASIARLWPNRIVVSVQERKPVAFLQLGPARFALIDEDGVILPPATDSFVLPVLDGVTTSEALADRRDRVHRMLRLTKDLGAEAQNISEIDVSDRDDLKVTAPRDGHLVTLLLGDHDFAQRYRTFLSYYKDIEKQRPDAVTLDLRLEDRITVVE